MVGLCVCVCFFGFAFEVCLGGWLVLLLVYYALRFEVVGLVLCGGCLEWVLCLCCSTAYCFSAGYVLVFCGVFCDFGDC